MTTHTITGIQVTFSGSNATAVAAQTMSMVTTDKFAFSYKLTTQAADAFSPITVRATSGSALYSVSVGGTRVSLDASAKVAQYSWGDGYTARILEVTTSATTKAYFVLDGEALPTFANLAAYQSFFTGLTNITSVSRNFDGTPPTVNRSPKDLKSFTASADNDTIVANATFDNYKVWNTGAGNDNITGLSTNEKFDLGVGNDTVNAGAGNDTVDGKAGNDSILGADGNDSLIGNVGDDTINGGNGDDIVRGGVGNDSILGDAGNDKLFGDAGNDYVSGGAGTDSIVGSTGNDTLLGGSENDTIYGGNDNDSIQGDAGDDLLRGDRGNDTVDGGAGADKMDGGYGNDVLRGGSENDTINGNVGNDSIQGDAGNDSLMGGDGKDTIVGGAGADTLKGGSGEDSFVFSLGHGADRVLDFKDNVDTLTFHTNLGNSSVSAALAEATQVGRNVVFNFGDGDTLTVLNITKLKLQNDIDFFS